MKKIILLIMLSITSIFYCQNNGISYQAVILNPSGEKLPGVNNENAPLANKPICLQFTIFDSSSQNEYQEIIQTITDEFGMVNLIIGSGPQSGGYASSFDGIVWSSPSQMSLKVALDLNQSCVSFEEISNQHFSSVPFAFMAAKATNVTGIITIENGGTEATTIIGAKTNLGLENVNNTSDLNKPISIKAQTMLNLKEDIDNKSRATSLGTSDDLYPTQNAVKTYVDTHIISTGVEDGTITNNKLAIDAVTTIKLADASVTDSKIAFGISPSKVGLENVNNTADLDKPVSIATQNKLSLKEATTNKSTDISTDATSDVKFPSVKAVKTYVDAQTVVGIADGTVTTAKLADASVTDSKIALGISPSKVGLENVNNTADLNKPISTATQIELNLKEDIGEINGTTLSILGIGILKNGLTGVPGLAVPGTDYALPNTNTTGTASNVTGIVAGANGGTGATNTGKTITLGGNLTTTGPFDTNLAVVGPTTLNLPLSGTLATLADLSASANAKEDSSNKTTDIATYATSDVKFPSAKAVKIYVDAQTAVGIADGTVTTAKLADASVTDSKIALGISPSKVGLENVNNTTDLNKPISTATQMELNLKEDIGEINGTTLSTLGIGILKNGLTGVPGLAVPGTDYALPNTNTTGTASNVTGIVAGANGGTGATNTGKTITLGGNLTTTGPFDTNLAVAGPTTLNLPVSGTLATLADLSASANAKEDSSNKTTDIATNATSDVKFPSAKAVKIYVDAQTAVGIADGTVTTAKLADASVTDSKIALGISPSKVGLENVNNTTDLNKPISTATQMELNLKEDIGEINGTTLSTLGIGILKNGLAGVPGLAVPGTDYASPNANTTGTASNVTGIIAGANGGTGATNTGKTITLGGNLTTTGAFDTNLAVAGPTTLNLPVFGTLATLDDLTAVNATNANLTGDVTSTGNTTTVTKINGISLAGLTTGILKNNTTTGEPIIAVARVDYAEPTTTLATGILKNTTSTGAHTIALAGIDYILPNGNISGTADNVTGVVAGTNGGTGIANTGKTITLGGNLTTGAHATTLTTTGTTTLTLPVTGTLATVDGVETLTNKSITGSSGGTSTIAGFNTVVNTVASTTYTLVQADNGKVLNFTSDTAVTLSILSGLSVGFNCLIVQYGAGVITLTANGTTVVNKSSYTKTAGTYSIVTIVSPVTNVFITNGNMN